MAHDLICENCKKSYKEKDRIFKKSWYKKIGKENWCDDCINNSDIDYDLVSS